MIKLVFVGANAQTVRMKTRPLFMLVIVFAIAALSLGMGRAPRGNAPRGIQCHRDYIVIESATLDAKRQKEVLAQLSKYPKGYLLTSWSKGAKGKVYGDLPAAAFTDTKRLEDRARAAGLTSWTNVIGFTCSVNCPPPKDSVPPRESMEKICKLLNAYR